MGALISDIGSANESNATDEAQNCRKHIHKDCHRDRPTTVRTHGGAEQLEHEAGRQSPTTRKCQQAMRNATTRAYRLSPRLAALEFGDRLDFGKLLLLAGFG